jgi:hypothetical protein
LSLAEQLGWLHPQYSRPLVWHIKVFLKIFPAQNKTFKFDTAVLQAQAFSIFDHFGADIK